MVFQEFEHDASRDLSRFRSRFDLQEIVKRAVKYLIEGAVVAVVAFFIPEKQMKIEHILVLALTAAATFAILDMWAPAIGVASRTGAGFGIGANLVGFPAGGNPAAGPSAIRM